MYTVYWLVYFRITFAYLRRGFEGGAAIFCMAQILQLYGHKTKCTFLMTSERAA